MEQRIGDNLKSRIPRPAKKTLICKKQQGEKTLQHGQSLPPKKQGAISTTRNQILSKKIIKSTKQVTAPLQHKQVSKHVNSTVVKDNLKTNQSTAVKSRSTIKISKPVTKPATTNKSSVASISQRNENKQTEQVIKKDNHVLQPDIKFIPDEQGRKFILSNRELTPTLLKRASTFRVSARPQSLFCRNRSSVFSMSQAREKTLQTLAEINEKRKARALAEGTTDAQANRPPFDRQSKLPFEFNRFSSGILTSNARKTSCYGRTFGSGKYPHIDQEKIEKQLQLIESMQFAKNPIPHKGVTKFDSSNFATKATSSPVVSSSRITVQAMFSSCVKSKSRPLQALENLLSETKKSPLKLDQKCLKPQIQDVSNKKSCFRNLFGEDKSSPFRMDSENSIQQMFNKAKNSEQKVKRIRFNLPNFACEDANNLSNPVQDKDQPDPSKDVSEETNFLELLRQKSESCTRPNFVIDEGDKELPSSPLHQSEKSKLEAEIQRLQAKLAKIDCSTNVSSEDIKTSHESPFLSSIKNENQEGADKLASPKFTSRPDSKLCLKSESSIEDSRPVKAERNTDLLFEEKNQFSSRNRSALLYKFIDLKMSSSLQKTRGDCFRTTASGTVDEKRSTLSNQNLSSRSGNESGLGRTGSTISSGKEPVVTTRDAMRRMSLFTGMLNPSRNDKAATAFDKLQRAFGQSSTKPLKSTDCGQNQTTDNLNSVTVLNSHSNVVPDLVNSYQVLKEATTNSKNNPVPDFTGRNRLRRGATTVSLSTFHKDNSVYNNQDSHHSTTNTFNAADPSGTCSNFQNTADKSGAYPSSMQADPPRNVDTFKALVSDGLRSSFYSTSVRGPMPVLCTPQPVCLRSSRVLTTFDSPDLLPERRTSAYLSSAPIRTPMVLRNLAIAASSPANQGSSACQQLKFDDDDDEEETTDELMERCLAKFGSVHDLMKHERLVDQLADHECQALLQNVPFPPEHRTEARTLLCPVAYTLQYGDDTHFIPIEIPRD